MVLKYVWVSCFMLTFNKNYRVVENLGAFVRIVDDSGTLRLISIRFFEEVTDSINV